MNSIRIFPSILFNRPNSRRFLPTTSKNRFYNNFRSPTWWLSLLLLLVSVLIGFQLGLAFICQIKRYFVGDVEIVSNSRNFLVNKTNSFVTVNLPHVFQEKQLILIAVMTSKDFLTTRAPTVMQTWAENIPGQVIFFSSEGSTTNDSRINLVSLPSVTDTYPPQKKSFLMMKYIHDHYLNKFEWFMRVDDDVYIRTDNLERLLRSIDNRNAYYIGQPGMGTKEEYGKLALGENENFCMGGPGIILSRETLARFTPHIKKCLKNFYTHHEDVELGRCVHKFANTSCTWSYEMQHILYNHPNKTDGYRAKNLVTTDILRAVSLHSIKDIRVFTRVHQFALQRRIIELEQRMMLIRRQTTLFEKILDFGKLIKTQRIKLTKLLGKTKNFKRKSNLKEQIRLLTMTDEQIAAQMMDVHNHSHRLILNENHHKKLTERHLRDVLRTYFNGTRDVSLTFLVDPTESIDVKKRVETGIYTLFTASQYAANTELPVRSIEPAFKQCFDEVVRTYMEDVNKISRSMGRFLEYKKTLYGYYKHEPRHGMNYILDLFLIYRKYAGKKMSVPVRKRVYVVQKFRSLYFRDLTLSSNSFVPIHMIVPVSGRLLTLKRLLTNFDQVVLRSTDVDLTNVHLYIILMETAEDSGERMSTISEYIKKFLQTHDAKRIHLIEVENGNFTRGYARSFGASRFNDTDLLFFIDLDMIFTRDLFPHIRQHTILNKQVYFPIIFSQYDPQYWEKLPIDTNLSSFHLRDDIGYWRQYGFGMLGIYKVDLGIIGNWNVEISGWGKEDVEIYDKLVQSPQLNVFRTVDNSLMHIFHTKECSPTLKEDQMNMCKGTKSITLGSQRILVEHVQKLIGLNRI